jgi:hypothetical protein
VSVVVEVGTDCEETWEARVARGCSAAADVNVVKEAKWEEEVVAVVGWAEDGTTFSCKQTIIFGLALALFRLWHSIWRGWHEEGDGALD